MITVAKKVIKNVEHIRRNFNSSTSHRIRYDEDSYRCEIFKYDRTNEYFLTANSLELDVVNGKRALSNAVDTEYLISSKGYDIVVNENNTDEDEIPMSIKKTFIVDTKGHYRFDLLYRAYSLMGNPLRANIEFYIDGELQQNPTEPFTNAFMFSRMQHYSDLDEGVHTIEYKTNSRVKVFGLTIREYVVYTGSRGSHNDLVIKSANITLSETLKADELEMEIFYFNELKEDETLTSDKRNPSGYIFDYRDEVNFYITDKLGKEKQVFGGYISSVKVDEDLTLMTLNCGGRLVDGDKRILMSQISLLGGDNEDTEYDTFEEMHHFFNTRGDILEYLTNSYEIPLIHSNIVGNADFTQNFVKKFNFGKNVENRIEVIKNPDNNDWSMMENMRSEENDDHIMIRNGTKLDATDSSMDTENNVQRLVIYDAKKYGAVKISPNTEDGGASNFWIEYGLGEPKYEVEVGVGGGAVTGKTTNYEKIWATSIEKQLADKITSARGYSAVQPIFSYLATHLPYPSNVYPNTRYAPDKIAQAIINGGVFYCNCSDRTVLLANLLAYKGVPNIYYAHGTNHMWVQLKDYDTVSGNDVNLDPAPSRLKFNQVWKNLKPYRLRKYPTSSREDIF